MKKVVAILCLLLFLQVPIIFAEETVIKCEDPMFEKIVRENIEKPFGDIHKQDVETITELVDR